MTIEKIMLEMGKRISYLEEKYTFWESKRQELLADLFHTSGTTMAEILKKPMPSSFTKKDDNYINKMRDIRHEISTLQQMYNTYREEYGYLWNDSERK